MDAKASTARSSWAWTRPVAYETRSRRALTGAALFFAVAAILHNADHFRRGTDAITTELLVAGSLGIVLSAIAVLLVLIRHPQAPQVAVGAGFVLALGFVAAHWLPTWSVFSDSFVDGDVGLVSQAASLLEILGALGLTAAGLFALRRSCARQRHVERSSATSPSR